MMYWHCDRWWLIWYFAGRNFVISDWDPASWPGNELGKAWIWPLPNYHIFLFQSRPVRSHNPDNIYVERQGAKYRSVLINMRTGVFAFGGLGVHLFDAAGWQLAGVFVFWWICWNTGGRVVVGGRVLVVESESRRWWNTPGGPGPGLDGRPTNPAQAGPLLLHLFTCVSSASPLWPSLASSWCCRAPATPPCPAGMHLWPSEAAVWVVQLLSGRAVFHE